MSIAQVAKAIDALGVNKRITEAFTEISTVSDDLNTQLVDQYNDITGQINNAVTQLATQIGQATTAVADELNISIAATNSELNNVSALASQTAGEVLDLQSDLADTNTGITSLTTEVNNNTSAISSLTTDVSNIQTQVAQAAGDISALEQDLATTNDTAGTLATTVSGLTTQTNNNASAIATHTANTSNPHSTTATQVGLGNVQNYDISSQAEAEAGSSNAKYMTPLRTAQAITLQAVTPLSAHTSNTSNPHSVTATQVGLGNVQNYGVASQAESEAGSATNKYMTPERTAQAIAALSVSGITTINQPAAGLTVSGTGNTRTLALADDTAAVEAISGTGIAVRTGTNAWTVRLVAGTQDKITVTNGDGGVGDITVTIANTYAGQASIVTVGTLTTGVWNATAIGTAYGGTNITSWTTGDLPYASATNVLSKLAGVATGNALVSGGIGVAPSWGKIGLSTHVSGNLPVTNLNSGTNASGTTFWAGDGTWKSISSSATLTSGRIGFGDGSNLLSGSSAFTYNDSTHTLQIGAGTGLSTFRTANASSGANAASLSFITGDANAGVVGAGVLKFQGGAGAGASDAGHLDFYGGDTTGSGSGGVITFNAGDSTGGAKGTVIFKIANVTIATVKTGGLEAASFIPTSTTGPADGMYKHSAGVVGLAANNVAAFKYGSNAFVSQTSNARDIGEVGTPFRDIFSANAVTVTSDQRTKTDIEDSPLGLDFINLLRAVSYRKIVGQIAVSEDGENTQTPMPGIRRHYGLLSQQVKQALDTLNVGDFAGWVLENVNDPDSLQALRYEQFISPLIKATQELDEKAQAQEARIQQLENQVQQLLGLLQ